MKILDIIKKVSKVLFYLSISFAAVFASVTYYETAWVRATSEGSRDAVACRIMVDQFQQENKLSDDDTKVVDLDELCAGISSRSFSLSVYDYPAY